MRAFLESITRYASYISALFLMAMMLVTVCDVVLRAVFNLPVTGTYDLVQLFLVGTVFLSIPDVFLRDRNIVIDFIDHFAGAHIIGMLKLIANVLGVVFLALLIWRTIPPALDSARFNEVSPDLSIPMDVHWALIIVGIALTLPAAICVLVESVHGVWRGQAER